MRRGVCWAECWGNCHVLDHALAIEDKQPVNSGILEQEKLSLDECYLARIGFLFPSNTYCSFLDY